MKRFQLDSRDILNLVAAILALACIVIRHLEQRQAERRMFAD